MRRTWRLCITALAALDAETTPTPALLEAWQLHQDQDVRSGSGGGSDRSL